MKDIQQIAFCAILSALSVVLMFIGSFFVPAVVPVVYVCGYLSAIMVFETKFSRALCAYFVVVVLANLFVARKGIVIFYALFGGIYPIIENKLNTISQLVLRVMFKLFVMSLSAFLIMFLMMFIMSFYEIEENGFTWVFYILYVISFFCFDVFLQELKKVYKLKLKPRILKNYF